MNPQHRFSPSAAAAHSRQRGVYALEWAIIFPVFFMLLYAIISYGLTFLVRESMQLAVEEGARAAVRYPSTATLAGATTPTWLHRRTEARNATAQALSWLPTGIRPTADNIQFTACHIPLSEKDDWKDDNCNSQTPLDTSIVCDMHTPCVVLVSYTINGYSSNGIAPAIPGLNLILPDTLEASASALIDRRML